MANETNSPVPGNYFLQPGFIYVAAKQTVVSIVIGSCVTVCIYDRHKRTSGVNHFQFPYIMEKDRTTTRYGNVATHTLIHMMVKNGSKLKNLEAQIFGGAHNPEISQENIGMENVAVARNIIEKNKVTIVSEDVGGKKGRKVVINTTTNEIAVVRVDKLRKGDWFPYTGDR